MQAPLAPTALASLGTSQRHTTPHRRTIRCDPQPRRARRAKRQLRKRDHQEQRRWWIVCVELPERPKIRGVAPMAQELAFNLRRVVWVATIDQATRAAVYRLEVERLERLSLALVSVRGKEQAPRQDQKKPIDAGSPACVDRRQGALPFSVCDNCIHVGSRLLKHPHRAQIDFKRKAPPTTAPAILSTASVRRLAILRESCHRHACRSSSAIVHTTHHLAGGSLQFSRRFRVPALSAPSPCCSANSSATLTLPWG